MTDIIHAHIYKPHLPTIFGKGRSNEKSELHVYTCDNTGECDAFKNGTCINVGNAFGSKCPVGKKSVTLGFTKRARSYSKQIRGWEEKYSDSYKAIKPAPKRITKVYGGWMLPYDYINMNESVPFKGKAGLFSGGCAFLANDDFNPENFRSVIDFKPRSLSGFVINDYQEEVVPKLIRDLSDLYPDQFEQISNALPRAKEILDSYTCVGREALLKTIRPNVEVTINRKLWWWDGEKISIKNKGFMIYDPVKWDSCFAEFFPKDGETVKITSDDQVTSSTILVD